MTDGAWSPAEATAFLLERELFGMRFELDRIKSVLAELGNPHQYFRSMHIVGTNGKSSTTRFCAALLTAEGVRAGAYLSPHLVGFNERALVPVDGALEPTSPEEFASAISEAARAAQKVELRLEPGDLVTQFELVTAASFLLFSRANVSVAAVEAGLGGRLDATNVLGSPKVVVLTSIGLDHTRWLGSDEESIATEKLAVVSAGDTLVIPTGLSSEARGVAEQRVERCGASLRVVDPAESRGVDLAAVGEFQLSNFALAAAAVEETLGRLGMEARTSAATTLVPGRLSTVGQDPLTLVDAAHNQQGAAGLATYLHSTSDRSTTTGVIGMLDDKDAAGFLAAMIPCVSRLVLTQPLNPRALSAEQLAGVALELGVAREDLVVEADPRKALELAKSMTDPRGTVIATGSVHLVGDLVSAPGERVVSSL